MSKMKCEEFEATGLDAERDTTLSDAERAAARQHVGLCPQCAALQDSWQSARAELRDLAEETIAAEAPARVEMRLLQEFRMQHRAFKSRRAAVIAAWALAAAAVVAGAVSWKNWLAARRQETAKYMHSLPPNNDSGLNSSAVSPRNQSAKENAGDESLFASNELSGFTLLPGVLPAETDDSAILRVRMQRGELGALGLPVDEESASEWIQVDLLVGNDGLPQAVRVPQQE
jgi:hypothetical protein